jgi:hypothetical protein
MTDRSAILVLAELGLVVDLDPAVPEDLHGGGREFVEMSTRGAMRHAHA